MKNEKKISMEADTAKLIAMFRAVNDVKSSNAALCVGSTVVENAGVQKLVGTGTPCKPENIAKLKLLFESFNKFLLAKEPGFTDVPRDFQGSPLRQCYTLLQQNAHCQEMATMRSFIPTLIRLINSYTVSLNFTHFYSTDIQKLNNYLTLNGAPKSILISEGYDHILRERASMLKKINDTSTFLNKIDPSSPTANVESQKNGIELIMKAKKIIQDCQCVDDGWMDHHAGGTDLLAPEEKCINAGIP